MRYEVIALDRYTAQLSIAQIRLAVLEAEECELCWARIPIEIDDLDQLADILEDWKISRTGASALNVERALDRHQVWVGRGVAIRRLKGARRMDKFRTRG